MKNKIIIVFMVSMLAFNFFAWTKLTVANTEDVKEIKTILKECKING